MAKTGKEVSRMISRRGLLASVIASCAAPAIISTPGLLMPIKPQLTVTPWDDLMIDCFADGGKPSIMLITKDMYDRFQNALTGLYRNQLDKPQNLC